MSAIPSTCTITYLNRIMSLGLNGNRRVFPSSESNPRKFKAEDPNHPLWSKFESSSKYFKANRELLKNRSNVYNEKKPNNTKKKHNKEYNEANKDVEKTEIMNIYETNKTEIHAKRMEKHRIQVEI